MTRAHARLLGPCFKTGPESTQNLSVANRRIGVCLRTSLPAVSMDPETALGPHYQITNRTCNEPDANLIAAPRHCYTVEQAGQEARGSAQTPRKASYGLHRCPIELHPTGCDVLLEVKCTHFTQVDHKRSHRSKLNQRSRRSQFARAEMR